MAGDACQTGMRIWRIATQKEDCPADDLSGSEALAGNGRWNHPGHPVVYCADSPALACVETLVHLDAGSLGVPRCLVAIELPEPLWQARLRCFARDLPPGWDAREPGDASRDFGTQWLESKASALLALPSAVVPESSVVLLNPLHPDAAQASADVVRHWTFDARLLFPAAG